VWLYNIPSQNIDNHCRNKICNNVTGASGWILPCLHKVEQCRLFLALNLNGNVRFWANVYITINSVNRPRVAIMTHLQETHLLKQIEWVQFVVLKWSSTTVAFIRYAAHTCVLGKRSVISAYRTANFKVIMNGNNNVMTFAVSILLTEHCINTTNWRKCCATILLKNVRMLTNINNHSCKQYCWVRSLLKTRRVVGTYLALPGPNLDHLFLLRHLWLCYSE